MSQLISAVLRVLGHAPVTKLCDESMGSKHTTSGVEKSRTDAADADSDVEEKNPSGWEDHKEVFGAGMVTTQVRLEARLHAYTKRMDLEQANRVDRYSMMPQQQTVAHQTGEQDEELFGHLEQDSYELYEMR
ncbi:hypothetical protein FRC10_011084, partial [Ceratobasidium sp. 414]